jgi:dipeptidyl aminopeptidase/acylaminoacyl peptidase
MRRFFSFFTFLAVIVGFLSNLQASSKNKNSQDKHQKHKSKADNHDHHSEKKEGHAHHFMNRNKPGKLNPFILVHISNISSPTAAKDGKKIFYTVSSQCYHGNKSRKNIMVASGRKKTKAKVLVNKKMQNYSPAVSPDSKKLAFIGVKKDKQPQIYLQAISGSDELKPLTTKENAPYGVGGPLVWSPDSGKILFTANVPPECDDLDCLQKKAAAKKTTDAQLFTGLLYRHWNHWRHGLIHKLFLLEVKTGKVKLLSKGKHDTPVVALGSSQDYVFSPDGKNVAWVSNHTDMVAANTNNDIFIYNLKSEKLTKLTKNKGNDFAPKYSPDGRYLAYQSMARAGYESDKADILLYDLKRKRSRNLTAKLDLKPYKYKFAPDRKYIYYTAFEKGHINLFRVDFRGRIKKVLNKKYIKDFLVFRRGKLIIHDQDIDKPVELYLVKNISRGERKNNIQALTALNSKIMEKVETGKVEEKWIKGAKGDKVHTLILKPPFFKEGEKYPVIFLLHGGPQGAFGFDFHPRWNSQLFAAPGYVVVMPNFHGSIGYGQKYQDAIRGDWGGAPYQDVMAVLKEVKKLPYVKPDKIGAAGASYGGYLINWIGTQTDAFQCLVSHSGVYNIESMYGSTEELWFPEWENKGTPWENRKLYDKWSPHRYVQNWKTPVLIVHGAKDFRVTVDQSMQLYTSVKRLGVKAKFLYFPNEDHFVFKPQNRGLWWKTVHQWFNNCLK